MNTRKVKRHRNSDTKNRQQRILTELPPWNGQKVVVPVERSVATTVRLFLLSIQNDARLHVVYNSDAAANKMEYLHRSFVACHGIGTKSQSVTECKLAS